MATAITKGTVVSFGNTPQAGDDVFSGLINEDTSGTVTLDVMLNDLGGNAKSLYSLDNGISDGGIRPTDLLTKDAVGATQYSALGAEISITADGKVAYHLTPALNAQFQSLGAGESVTDTFTYAIKLGNGTLSWATASVTIAGTNDGPVITSGPQSGGVSEGDNGQSMTATGQVTYTDADINDTHSFSAGAASHGTASVDASGHWTYTVSDSGAVDALAAGEQLTDSFTVTVADNHGGTASQVVNILITGTNDAPVVSGAVSGAATEDGATSTLDALANASDVDHNTTLSVTDVPALPAGVSYDAGTHSFTLDPSNAAYQHLADGEQTTVTVSYNVSDGTTTTPASVEWTVTGTNDDASITGVNTGSVSEDGQLTAGGTLVVSDVDTGQGAFAASDNGSHAGAHGTFSFDTSSGAWTYALNNGDAAVQALNTGDTLTDTLTVHSLDGTASDDIVVTINGADEAPPPPVITDIAPVAGADHWVISNNNNVTVDSSWLTWNDTDADHDGLYVTNVSLVSGSGSVTGVLDGSGHVAGVHITGMTSDLNLQYTLSDGTLTSNGSVTVQLADRATAGADTINLGDATYSGYDHASIDGQNGDDAISGSATSIVNVLNGGNGADTLVGGNGNDTFMGSSAGDTLTGGGGADTFIYNTGDSQPGAGKFDTITDFQSGADKIDLSALGALAVQGSLGGGSTINANSIAWKASGADMIVYVDTAGHTETAGVTSGNLAPDVEIHLTGVSSLSSSDFIFHT